MLNTLPPQMQGQYNTIKASQCRGGSDDPRMCDPIPQPKASPILQELQELQDVLEHLEKQHFILSDRLRVIYPMDTTSPNKLAAGVASEPSTGCELKDRIAYGKQQALYIQRLYGELTEKLWI